MRFDILTLFPEMFSGYLSQSLLKLAIDRSLISVNVHNLRDWSPDPKHHKVDDRPFGGGPGMVIRVEPAVEGVEAVRSLAEEPGQVILLTPQGRRLDQHVVEQLATKRRLIVLCGRYEGFDERVKTILEPEEISVGDFVLNGGEVAAMVLVDTVIRLVPGVLGDERSSAEDSFSGHERLLEFSQYTRPREYRGHEVPEVLLSGDHEAIARWRREESLQRTHRRRGPPLPDQNSSPDDKTHEKNIVE